MRQRIAALSGVSVVALLGLFLVWGAIGTRPASAMEKMAESVGRAKSCKMTAIMRTTRFLKSDDAAKPAGKTTESKDTMYWQTPDKARGEFVCCERPCTNIFPGEGKPWIDLNHEARTFHLHPAPDVDWQRAFAPDMIVAYADRADRDLGTKEIDGKMAWGFAISDPDISVPGLWEIWIDRQSNLPVSIRAEMKTERMTSVTETTEILWNLDLDPQLFDATPPEGYRDLTLRVPTSGDPLQEIIEGMRSWVQMPQGEYLPMKQPLRQKEVEIYLLSIDRILTDPKRIGNGENAELLSPLREHREGLLHLWAIAGEDRDVAYYGKTVGPDDEDKVLLRWKLDDDRYQVIYGDLHHETVTAEQLAVLEAE